MKRVDPHLIDVLGYLLDGHRPKAAFRLAGLTFSQSCWWRRKRPDLWACYMAVRGRDAEVQP